MVAEVALAVILVIGAGLMIRSLAALGRIDLGFNPDRVLTMRLAVPAARYDTPEKVVDFYHQLLERVRALPGVEAAGVVRVLPLATTIGDYGLDVEGYEESPGRERQGRLADRVRRRVRGDGHAAGARPLVHAAPTPRRRSRWRSSTRRMARTYWKDGNAVGGRMRRRQHERIQLAPVVVGIVADERHNGVTGIVKEKFYVPHSQWHVATGGNLIRNVFIVVRTPGDPMAVAGAGARR